MSDDLNREEPAPTVGTGPDCWELVLADMAQRRQVGIARYGTVLQADNGRDALVDAYQEGLDLCVYLRQAIEQRRTLERELANFRQVAKNHWREIEDAYAALCDAGVYMTPGDAEDLKDGIARLADRKGERGTVYVVERVVDYVGASLVAVFRAEDAAIEHADREFDQLAGVVTDVRYEVRKVEVQG